MAQGQIGLRTYFAVFIALMILTAVTVYVAFVDLGALNNVAALGIAVVKATLVILFFMHLKDSTAVSKVAIASTTFFLVLLIGIVLADVVTREMLSDPAQRSLP